VRREYAFPRPNNKFPSGNRAGQIWDVPSVRDALGRHGSGRWRRVGRNNHPPRTGHFAVPLVEAFFSAAMHRLTIHVHYQACEKIKRKAK